MRVVGKKENLDYNKTKEFFKNRAEKFSELNPYTVTMYQDKHPEIVVERNKRELEKLKPYLELDSKSRVLDIACGIGRWADSITEDIEEYNGIDFSEELIQIARKRNVRENFRFHVGSATEIEKVMGTEKEYNTIIMCGILIYLNDSDLKVTLEQVERLCAKNTVICIREPIALGECLTLKDFYSDELNAEYNAIYRNREELFSIYNEILIRKGFIIKDEGFLFAEDKLNNRKETAQYFFIFERKEV